MVLSDLYADLDRQNKRIIYNGHKRIHTLTFQSVAAPNGLIANLFGPAEGCKHDTGSVTNLSSSTTVFSQSKWTTLSFLIDPNLKVPFKSNNLTPLQKQYNKAMSEV